MEKLNLVEILKNVPKGTKLYSPIFGDVTLVRLCEDEKYPIVVEAIMFPNIVSAYAFTKEGHTYPYPECLLFPSKENRDWSTFKFEYQFKVGDPVWVSDDADIWEFGYFSEKYSDPDNEFRYRITTLNGKKGIPYRICKPFTGQDPYKD